MRKLCLLFVFLFISLSITANPLIGYWLSSDGEFYHFDMNTVTTGLYNSDNIENTVYDYSINDNIIELTRAGASYSYTYRVNTEDGTLTLSPITDSSDNIILYGSNSIMQEEIVVGLKIQNP